MSGRFFALIHDLSDCAVAMIYCDDSKAGPAEIVAVVPPGRRSHLRDEFSFEFLTFARFLGSLSERAALEVHNAVEEALAARDGNSTLVFSISSATWSSEPDPVLSLCVEKIALTLWHWLDEKSKASVAKLPGEIPAA